MGVDLESPGNTIQIKRPRTFPDTVSSAGNIFSLFTRHMSFQIFLLVGRTFSKIVGQCSVTDCYFQLWSVIGDRNSRWLNRNDTPRPENKRHYGTYLPVKIEDWKSCTLQRRDSVPEFNLVHIFGKPPCTFWVHRPTFNEPLLYFVPCREFSCWIIYTNMNEKLRPPVTKEPFTTPRNATVKRLRNSGWGYSLLLFTF